MKKVYPQKTGSDLVIVGNCKWIELDYQVPEWDLEKPESEQYPESCFSYKDHVYFLFDFQKTDRNSGLFKDYDGIFPESYFSGILIKLPSPKDYDHDGMVQVFSYYC